tara:strand:+ start:293 stop:1213 length:921 start_codon:yes stop_codon:yes gene_type:complete
MATQQVRNMIRSQVDGALKRAKIELRNEAKKKINELKNQLLSPEEIMKKLQVEINDDSCSPEGNEKFMSVYNQLHDVLTNLQNIAKGALEKIEGIELKVNPLIEAEGPLGVIRNLGTIIKDTMAPAMQLIVFAAPALLAAFVGPAANGPGIDQVQQKRDRAKRKVVALLALATSIPLMVMFYQNEAKKIMNKLTPIKDVIIEIDEKITELLLFMVSLLLQYEEGCNDLKNSQNASTGSLIPDPNGSTPLKEYMELLKTQYSDVYNKLQEAGNEKALERIFTIKENLEEDYNISFKIININSNKKNT